MAQDEERMVIEECAECKFYNSTDYEVDEIQYNRSYGLCRRFPPRRIDGMNAGFPTVEDDWWCGEFQKNFPSSDK